MSFILCGTLGLLALRDVVLFVVLLMCLVDPVWHLDHLDHLLEGEIR